MSEWNDFVESLPPAKQFLAEVYGFLDYYLDNSTNPSWAARDNSNKEMLRNGLHRLLEHIDLAELRSAIADELGIR